MSALPNKIGIIKHVKRIQVDHNFQLLGTEYSHMVSSEHKRAHCEVSLWLNKIGNYIKFS
jgi:hypothetical protein